jgi:glycine dehydrogenase subunit 1
MAQYVPNTKSEQLKMLEEIGKTWNDLLSPIPVGVRLNRELDLPPGISEFEVMAKMASYAKENKVFSTVLRGAGAYRHLIPSVVRHLSSREEFVTAYTPYQAEFSQGILQSIFEYQTMICQLTGMDASNASVYDGASAVAEAVNMTVDKKRRRALLSANLDPQSIMTVKTYTQHLPIDVEIIPSKDGRLDLQWLKDNLSEDLACVVVQHPNYYGILEDTQAISDVVHSTKAKMIVSVNPISLAVFKEPRAYGADIAVGEAQPLGLNIAFGGPYLGFMATTNEMVRKLPGRIVGQTLDLDGKRAFVLTLQAREQHIRREKASSSLCSNQAHCALTAAMYLTSMGPQGLKDVASQCFHKAHFLQKQLAALDFKLKYNQPFFHEFVTTTPVSTDKIVQHLEQHDVLAGLPLDDHTMLWCVTEAVSEKEIHTVLRLLEEVSA